MWTRPYVMTILLASGVVAGAVWPANAEVDPEEPPLAISVAVAEGSGADVQENPTAATLDIVAAAQKKPTCTTTAVPPQELDVFDPTRFKARTELDCGDAHYVAQLTVQFKYYGKDPAGPVGSGTLVGTQQLVEGAAPQTAITKLGKLEAPSGWYKTVGRSSVTYPFKLNTRRSPGKGCSYSSSYTVVCNVASSAVFVETIEYVIEDVVVT